jgi:NADH-quinone oxidoreductase subunit G
VLAKATATAPVLSNASHTTSANLRMAGEVAAPVVASIYQLDGVVRRAPSLQLTADARTAQEVAA